jgi:hypothetical protein
MYSLAGTHLDFSSLLLKQISSTEWPEKSTATFSRLNQQVGLALLDTFSCQTMPITLSVVVSLFITSDLDSVL